MKSISSKLNQSHTTSNRSNLNKSSQILNKYNQNKIGLKKNIDISKETLNLDLNSIREILNLIKTHEKKCNDEGKFIEADLLRERIEKLTLLQEEKILKDYLNTHEQQLQELHEKQTASLNEFNKSYDEIFFNLKEEYEINEKNFVELHKKQIEMMKQNILENYPEHPKPTAKILKLTDNLRNLQKQRKYFFNIVIKKQV